MTLDETGPPTSYPELNEETSEPHTEAATGFEVQAPELVWPGKYTGRERAAQTPRVSLPFQLIEVIEEGRASREDLTQGSLPLFGAQPRGLDQEGWRNKLIWGDNLLVMNSLLREFAGQIDLIYIDPPFATGADFTVSTEIGEDGGTAVTKTRSILEEKAYRDTWERGLESYLAMMAPRLTVMRELLSENGSIYVHLDPTVGHYVKVLMDEVFGPDSFQREIVWRIGWVSGYKSAAKNWIRNHDTILFYVKTPGDFTFNKLYSPYPEGYVRRDGSPPTGKGVPLEDVWNANESEFALAGEDSLDSIQIKSFSTEKTGYPTQKNESLLRRIIEASSNPGDLVADFFSGSGTTLAAAEKLGRRWIGGDLGRFAIHTTRKRLLDLRVQEEDGVESRGCKPFEVLNLGQYERKYWQGITFGKGDLREPDQAALAAYVRFVLDLYNAQPLSGQHIHGKKGTGLVHVGAVDAPVTISQVEQALEETRKRGAHELHVLGWEWEMGLHDPLAKMAKAQHGVTLRLLSIPREVMDRRATEAGEVRFFDLAHLEVELKSGSGAEGSRRVTAKLTDFVIPNMELIPEDVRRMVREWSDYIDYWAVDWDFRDDTFINQWQTYRTPKDRRLTLESSEHTYDSPGAYRVLVKVVDVFGNDTSHLLSWEAK